MGGGVGRGGGQVGVGLVGGQGGCECNVGGRGDVGYGGCEPRIEGIVQCTNIAKSEQGSHTPGGSH